MKILLDTNFVLTAIKQKIDFDSSANELFDEVIRKFINSNELEVAIQGFTGNPIVIKTSLKGFSKGLTQLQKKSKFN